MQKRHLEFDHVFAQVSDGPLILAAALENPAERGLGDLQTDPVDQEDKQDHKG